MSKQFEFSLKVLDEWKQIWTTETIKYLKTAQEKVCYTIMDLNSFYYVQNELDKKNEILLKELQEGRPLEIPLRPNLLMIDFYYTEQPAEFFMGKVTLNFYSSVHSFFDNYAHFLHKALFSDPLPDKLSFEQVIKKISLDTSMQIIKLMIEKNKGAMYPYVRDINNMNKHIKHIHPISELRFDTGKQTFSFPAFKKGNNDHDEKTTKETLEDSCEMIIDFFNEVTKSVYHYSKNKVEDK